MTGELVMARYDYRCSSCGTVFEVEHGMKERPEVTCPKCGGACTRVFRPTGIEFKGNGYYNTDMRGGSSNTEAMSGPTASEYEAAKQAGYEAVESLDDDE